MDVRWMSLLCALTLTAGTARALPFNDDMVDDQLRTGAIMRSKVPGTVAVGFAGQQPASKEEAKKLENPLKNDPGSAVRGKRLFQVNCAPCHGDISIRPYQPGPVSVNSKGKIPGVDLANALYAQGMYEADGYFYATIHFGGLVIMPPLGWKLSPGEHWDIVNYVRTVQREAGGNAEASATKSPE